MQLILKLLIFTCCIQCFCFCLPEGDIASEGNQPEGLFLFKTREDLIEAEREGKSMFNGMFSSGNKNKHKRCMSNQEDGVCYSRSDCTKYGGTAGERCSENSGVCCILKSMCAANNTGDSVTVKRNLTHLVEPTKYTPPQQCRFNIPKQRGVCQLRLDFKRFSLAPPDAQGNCNGDVMVITGTDNIRTLKLCGDAQDQHLYLHYGSSDLISVSLNLLNAETNVNRAIYDILVTMIKCDSSERAPEGCSQYFTQTSGQIRSFNYKNRVQLNEQMYMTCIRSFTGSTKIKWEQCTAEDTFLISGTSSSGALSGTGCSTDYIEILGSSGGKYCGSEFPAVVTSEAKPLMMWVSFDDVEIPLPNTPLDPTTGCPHEWTCAGPGTPMCGKDDTSYCTPPAWFSDLTDFGNTGFCLRYTVS